MSVFGPKNLVPKFFDRTSSTYEKVVKFTTFGKDSHWKGEILSKIPEGKLFLDLACGTGILTRKIAKKFPNSTIIGIDITLSYLREAKKRSKYFSNIIYFHQDAEELDIKYEFDCITSSFIPKYCNPKILVENCEKHLKKQGRIIFHDFVYPTNSLIKPLWNVYFVILRGLGFLVPSWKLAFKELPKLIKSSNWLVDYEREFKRKGFEVKISFLTLHTAAIIIAVKNNESEF